MRKIKLELRLDSQLPAIYGVADHLTQVIMNLLINAADALETAHDQRSKEITLNTISGQDYVQLSVTDNGCGMNQDTLSRVFEAFFTTKSKGNGLGLSLCYSIITGHGGTIDIASIPGEGTQVKVILPLPTPEEDAA